MGINIDSYPSATVLEMLNIPFFPNVILHKLMVIGPFKEGVGNEYCIYLCFRVLPYGYSAFSSVSWSWPENWFTLQTRIMTFYWKIWPQTHNHPYLILLGYISLFAHLYCPWQYCVLLTISIALYRSVSTGHHFDPASYYIYYHTHLASHAYIPQLAIYYFWILSYSFISKPVL